MPRFSIITVCYNSEKTIERTIESVLSQTYDDYEYIIIDGDSKDNTIDIVKSYEDRFNGKLKYISEKDNGIYDAMNKGINMASGELIGLINSDDYYENDALKTVSDMFENIDSKEHLVIYGFQRVTVNNQEIAVELYHHNNLDKQMISHPTCFVSNKTYKDFGGFNTKYKSAADYDFMMRLFHKTDTIFVPVYKIITNFERGGVSGSGGVGQTEVAMIRNEYGLVPNGRIVYEKFHAMLVKIYRKIFK